MIYFTFVMAQASLFLSMKWGYGRSMLIILTMEEDIQQWRFGKIRLNEDTCNSLHFVTQLFMTIFRSIDEQVLYHLKDIRTRKEQF